MIIKTFINGLLPRSKELRRALRSYQKGNIDAKMLDDIYNEEAKKYISIQREANFSLIYDGMLKWQDLLRPLCKYKGIKEGTLIRWFETNFFYRMPIVENRITFNEHVISDHILIQALKGIENISLSIPDPLSFAMLSENRYYTKIRDLIKDLGDTLIKDLDYLDLPKKNIIILSPAIGYFGIDKEGILLYEDFLRQLKSLRKDLKIFVHLSFIKNPKILNLFSNLDIDVLSLDLCYGNRLEILKNIPETNGLSLGLIDVSTSLIEEKQYLILEIKRILYSRDFKEIFVTNSADLDLLPFEVAVQKINSLKELANYEI